jgi:hypothetical protein
MGLDNLELVTGTTPSFVNMANTTATSATGQSLYVMTLVQQLLWLLITLGPRLQMEHLQKFF